MTISTTKTRDTYTSNGTTKTYAINFLFVEETDILVYVNGYISTDYNITNSSLTFNTAPPEGFGVVFVRNTEKTQETNYPQGEKTHEEALDKLTLIVQELSEGLDRAISLPENSAETPKFELPRSSKQRKNKILSFNDTGDLVLEDKDSLKGQNGLNGLNGQNGKDGVRGKDEENTRWTNIAVLRAPLTSWKVPNNVTSVHMRLCGGGGGAGIRNVVGGYGSDGTATKILNDSGSVLHRAKGGIGGNVHEVGFIPVEPSVLTNLNTDRIFNQLTPISKGGSNLVDTTISSGSPAGETQYVLDVEKGDNILFTIGKAGDNGVKDASFITSDNQAEDGFIEIIW